MAVAPNGDPGLWPVPSDAADETAQVTAHFDPRGGFAGTQQHGDRSACLIVPQPEDDSSQLVYIASPYSVLSICHEQIKNSLIGCQVALLRSSGKHQTDEFRL